MEAILIDTAKAQAILRFHSIQCTGHVFPNPHDKKAGSASEQLIDFIEAYFTSSDLRSISSQAIPSHYSPRVMFTGKPPLYLQRPRHSLTVVGFETRKNGEKNLLVLDPAHPASRAIISISPQKSIARAHVKLLRPYRVENRELRKYDAFEVLTLRAD